MRTSQPDEPIDFLLELDPVDSGLPEGDPENCLPLTYSGVEGRAVVLSDTHFPFYDRKFIEYVISQAKKLKAKHLIHAGDLYDFHRLSRFKKYRESRSVGSELSMGEAFGAYVREQLGKDCHIDIVPGNHDTRFADHVIEKVPELKDLPCLSLESVSGLAKYGIRWASDGVGIDMNGLRILHGHETEGKFGSSSGNPANRLIGKMMADTVCGHHHVSDESHRTTGDGRQISCYTLGCTSTLNPKWCRFTNWCHGFAVVEFFKRGGYRVTNLRRKNGMMV